MRTKTALALAGLLALGFVARGGNLVPEGTRDVVVPFKGEGKMGVVYTPVFFPKGTEALVFTCDVKYDGVEQGALKWFDARIMTDFIDSNSQKLKGGPAIGGW